MKKGDMPKVWERRKRSFTLGIPEFAKEIDAIEDEFKNDLWSAQHGRKIRFGKWGKVILPKLRELGISYKELEDDGTALPVSHYSIDYKRPAYYDDELKIITTILSCEGVRIEFEYEVLNSHLL